MNAYRRVSYTGIFLSLIGLGVVLYGLHLYQQKKELDTKGIIVKGKVIDIHKDYMYRQPLVQFRTRKGQLVTFLSDLKVDRSLFKYKVGQIVDVIYDPDNPHKRAEINAFFERNTRHLWTLIVGVCVVFTGVLVRSLFQKKARTWELQQAGKLSAPSPEDYRRQANRAAWIAFGVLLFLIGILVFVYGMWGNADIWTG